MDLLKSHCAPCEGGTVPLFMPEAQAMMQHVPQWQLSPDAKKISREFKVKNFLEALALANSIGALAEEEGHHPDLLVAWGKLRAELSTHAIGGLSNNDFILAAKIDALA